MYAHLWHIDGERGEADREIIIGPFEGVQLTYNVLRETATGENIAYFTHRGWLTRTTPRSATYSDITFSDTRPESVVG